MKLHELDFSGHFEDQGPRSAERLQVLEPEDDLETRLLAWAMLAHNETVTDDAARPGLTFSYELGEHLKRGLYRLRVTARDGTNRTWEAEATAGVVATTVPAQGGLAGGFDTFWFLSERLHFRPTTGQLARPYGGEAYGRLAFGLMGNANLPHQRLFRGEKGGGA